MTSTKIDFRSIRSHDGGQDSGFEELTRQLILANPPDGYTKIENRGKGADGGVEILVRLENGTCLGWQSKYFINGIRSSQIQQIRKSLFTAVERYPTLSEYFVVIPKNLSGDADGNKKTERQLWEDFTARAYEELKSQDREIKIILWDESEQVSQLSIMNPVYAGLCSYWFDCQRFTTEWFTQKLNITLEDLGERYSSDDHVDVSVQPYLDTICRNEDYLDRIIKYKKVLQDAISTLSNLQTTTYKTDLIFKAKTQVLSTLSAVYQDILNTDWEEQSKIKLSSFIKRVNQLQASEELDKIRQGYFFLKEKHNLDPNELIDRDRLWAALSKTHDCFDHQLDIAPDLLEEAVLLVKGDAGTGKSHLLAHTSQEHINSGGPAIMILGDHLCNENPRIDILDRCGLKNLSFPDFLGTLQAAAIASGKPALLVIDAINDSSNSYKWKRNLSGMCEEISHFDRIALIISCRSTYLDYCLPKNWSGSVVEHIGFSGNEDSAAKKYLDNHGITRPSTPFLDPEFSNPLFLSTVVRTLKKRGETSFPIGLDGITTIFQFWLDGVEASLISKGFDRIISGDGRLLKAIILFSEQLALEKSEKLNFEIAQTLLEIVVEEYPAEKPSETLIQKFIDEGVLIKSPSSDNTTEVVFFTFQRFSDHFIVRTILDLFDTPELLAEALSPDGEYGYIFKKNNWRFLGLIEALYIQVPEKFNVELPILISQFYENISFPVLEFLNSLCWRSSIATNDGTIDLFQSQFDQGNITQRQFFNTLLQVSALPDHKLNAKYLDTYLRTMHLTKRDQSWSQYLCNAIDEDHPTSTLIDWSWQTCTQYTDIQNIELIATVLVWQTSTPDRKVRDQSTKAITSLIYQYPKLANILLTKFTDVDDPYIRERILGAVCGAFLHIQDAKDFHIEVSLTTYRMVFETCIERNVFIRRYARSIIEAAYNKYGEMEGISIERVRPPYSTDPIINWPSVEDLVNIGEIAPAIKSSVVGYLKEEKNTFEIAGDFGRYIMSEIPHSFSQKSRIDGPPVFPKDEIAEFWKQVDELGPEFKELSQMARSEYQMLYIGELLKRDEMEVSKSPKENDKDQGENEDTFQNIEERLLALLPQHLTITYHAISPYGQSCDSRLPMFSLTEAQRWVAARAIEIGQFTVDSPEPNSPSHSLDRRDHFVERLGKKYQWIAWHELRGYLIDHHWYIDWQNNFSALEDSDEFHLTDIDPSYLLKDVPPLNDRADIPSITMPEILFKKCDKAKALQWVSTLQDIPEIPNFININSDDDIGWWVIDAFWRDTEYFNKMKSNEVFQTAQYWLDFVILSPGEAQKLYNLVKNSNIVGETIAHVDEYSESLLGEFQPGNKQHSEKQYLHTKFNGISVGSILQSHKAIREEYDQSGEAGCSFQVPSHSIIEMLNLRAENPRSRIFLNSNNQPVFADLVPHSWQNNNLAVFRVDALKDFLEKEKFIPVWFLRGEKDGGMGHGENLNWNKEGARQGFCGMWWLENDKWYGSNWLAPKV